jgi:predicted ATPase
MGFAATQSLTIVLEATSIARGSQFLTQTHSPILMAYRTATVFQLFGAYISPIAPEPE